MYLQVTRYLVKNYKYALTKKKEVGESVAYLQQFSDILGARVAEDRVELSKWNLEDIELLLKQSACHCLGLVTSKMLSKGEGVSDLDVWNKIAGV